MSNKNNNNKKDKKPFDQNKENNGNDNNLGNNERSHTNEAIFYIKHKKYFPNKYNPSVGNSRPFLTKEMENMIKELKIDYTSHKIPNDIQENILTSVIHCLLQYHYNSKDLEHLKNFFFEFNQKICENPLEREEMEDLWIQTTEHIEIVSGNDEKDTSFNEYEKINKEDVLSKVNLIDNKEIHKKNKKNIIVNKSKQKNHTIASGLSENIIDYEQKKEKLLSLCDYKPPIDQIVKYLKLMHKLLCKEWGYLCKQEIIDKIVNDVGSAIGLSKEQTRRLLLEEDI